MKIEVDTNVLKNTLIIVALLLLIGGVTLYVCNENFRVIINTYIFKREIVEEDAKNIELTGEDNEFVYAYDKYIVILKNGKLDFYNSSGNKEYSIDVTISNPIVTSSGRFLLIAENNGQKFYVISGQNIVWQNEIEGNINKININKNGYVSVMVKGTSYKNVIITYNSEGKELFKTYLQSTNTVAMDISNDNKYLAIAEVNSSGSTIQSNIKIISFQKAETDPINSVVYTYKEENNSLITNIKYQDKAILVCMYDTGVHLIQEQKDEVFLETMEDTAYMDINLKNTVVNIENKQKGILNTQTQVIFKNINNKTESLYTLDGITNNLDSCGDNIAINVGDEVHFVNTSGWLVKRYKANKEITNIVIGENIAGVVYRDKVDIISL